MVPLKIPSHTSDLAAFEENVPSTTDAISVYLGVVLGAWAGYRLGDKNPVAASVLGALLGASGSYSICRALNFC